LPASGIDEVDGPCQPKLLAATILMAVTPTAIVGLGVGVGVGTLIFISAPILAKRAPIALERASHAAPGRVENRSPLTPLRTVRVTLDPSAWNTQHCPCP
jgi:hypothetical protein